MPEKDPVYLQPIKDAVSILCNELIKYYPDVFKQTYDPRGFPMEGGCEFHQRMEMTIYIELIKAGERFENDMGKIP